MIDGDCFYKSTGLPSGPIKLTSMIWVQTWVYEQNTYFI